MNLITQSAGNYNFAANGSSSAVNELGMRPMQELVYQKRDAQYLLIKAPPACGKSRALMYVALDKLQNQGIKKVIVAVPQKAIGSSFKDTKLGKFGQDWKVNPFYDLSKDDLLNDNSKADRIKTFLKDPNNSTLICSHVTLIKFYKNLQDKSILNQSLVAIDEFHHASIEEDNQLGGIVKSLMDNTSAHIVAMTGSYFRGDRISVLSAEDEAKFQQVIYTYYQQLNGYQYLKHLKLDYSFYDGDWLEGLDMILNPSHEPDDYSTITPQDYYDPESLCFDRDCGKPNIDLKTIIYIPKVNSSASSGDKKNEFKAVCEILGYDGSKSMDIDSQTSFYNITTRNGKRIKVANLVYESTQKQTLNALRQIKSRDEVDIIVALEMAKEGFDWPWCEHVLVAGFRGSLTETVQIIGRATRDCPDKPLAKFTNLIKAPDTVKGDVQAAVDDLIKAISLSLMMEQVLLPNVKFVPRSEVQDDPERSLGGNSNGGDSSPDIDDKKVIIINDEELTPKVKSYIKDPTVVMDQANYVINHLPQLKSHIITPPEQKAYVDELLENDIAMLLSKNKPESDWSYNDLLALAKLVKIQLNEKLSNQLSTQQNQDNNGENNQHDHSTSIVQDSVHISNAGSAILNIRKHFINVSELDFTLIAQCNPFGGAYEFVSRILDAEVLKEVQHQAKLSQNKMTEEEATALYPAIKRFQATYHQFPKLDSRNAYEVRLAAALQVLRNRKKLKLKQTQA